MKKFTLCFILSAISTQYVCAETALSVSPGLTIRTSPEYSKTMVNWQQDTSYKPVYMLESRKNGLIKPDSLYISAGFRGQYMKERTNVANKFPNLGRFPAQHKGKNGSEFIIPNAAIALTAPINQWVTAFGQFEYTDTAYKNQDKLQLRKMYATFGDLSQFPVYGFFGKNTIDFGDNQSYHQMTHSMNYHSFAAVSDAPIAGIGYADYGFKTTATLIPGGRHLRTADTPETNGLNNFAINSEKTFELSPKTSIRVGGGYLHGTIYNADFPHHVQAEIDAGLAAGGHIKNVPAAAVYGEFKTGPVKFSAEYSETLKQWPTTKHKLSAMTFQAAHAHKIFGKNAQVAASYGRTNIDDKTTEWGYMEQFVLGYDIDLDDTFTVSAEIMRINGFAPLAALTVPGASKQSVQSDTIMLGVKMNF